MANVNITTTTELWSVGGYFQMAELDANDRPICFRNVGIVEDVTLTPNITEIECKDELGRTFEKCVTETEVTMSMNFKSFNRRNLARVLYGSQSIIPASTGNQKTVVACHDGIIPLGGIDRTVTAVQNDTLGAAMIPGENYTVNCGSINVLGAAEQALAATPSQQTDPEDDTTADTWTITYDCAEQSCVEGYTRNSVNVGIFFEGINRCNDEPVFVEIFNVSLDPATFNLLSPDEFGRLAANGTLQTTRDPDVVAAGGSRLYKQCYRSN